MPLHEETIMLDGKTVTIKTGSVLDLSEDQQRQLAVREGKTPDAWRRDAEASLETLHAFSAKLQANEGIRPDGWTDEDAARWQRKVDSSKPGKITPPLWADD